MNNRKIAFCITLWLATLSASNGQTEKVTLPDFLTAIEKQHKVQFNYDATFAVNLSLAPIDITNNFEKLINYIESTLPIVFTRLGNGVYLATPQKKYCGYLFDNITQKPLEKVSIITDTQTLFTNKDGFFSFYDNRNDVSAFFEKEGYSTTAIVLTQKKCTNYSLTPSNQILDEVLISSYLIKGIDQNKNGNIIIDYDDFSILPGMIETDVLTAIKSLPGITSVNETVNNINIRGGSHDQNLITWDGIKMYKSGHFFGLISNFNPQITKRTEVIKNGTNPLLTDGISGSIVMETDNKVNKKIEGSIGVNFLNVDGYIDAPISQKSSLQVAGRKALNPYFNTPTYDNFFQRISQDTEVSVNNNGVINSNKTFDFYDASLRYIYQFNEYDVLKINLFNSDNSLSFDETSTENNDNTIIDSRTSSLLQNNFGASIFYAKKLSRKIDGIFQIYQTDYKLMAENANVLENQRFLQENIVSETSTKAYVNIENNKESKIIAGYEFTETEITDVNDIDNPLFRRLLSNVLRKHAVFSNYSKESKKNKSFIQAGVRFNAIPELDVYRIEPRIHYSQEVLKNTTFLVSGELKNQTTTQIINFQNDFLGIEKRRWQLSNGEDIPVLKSVQISSGIQFNKKSWLLSAEGYYKKVDGITSRSQSFQTKYEFERVIGSYNVLGIDALIRYNSKKITSWLSYSTMNNTYTFESLPENTFASNFNINHSVSYGITYQSNGFQMASGLQWRAGIPTTEPDGSNPIIDDAVNFRDVNSSELPSYFRWDASILYTFNRDKKVQTTVGLSTLNILNTTNTINRFYRIVEDRVATFNQQALISTINATARFTF